MAHPVRPFFPAVGADLLPRRLQGFGPADVPIEAVEAKSLLLFGLLTQLLSQSGEFRRQEPIVDPIVLRRFFCRRFHQSVPRSSHSARLPPRPLRSTGITPLHHYYGPLRLPPVTTPEVIDSPGGLSAHPTSRRVSQVPGCSFRARRLLSPRRALPVLSTVPSRQVLASSYPTGWPPSTCVTRLNRVRLRYGSRVCLPRLRRRGYPRSPLGRLHVQRSIHMADSFHSARTAKLCLAHQRTQRAQRHQELLWLRRNDFRRWAGVKVAGQAVAAVSKAWKEEGKSLPRLGNCPSGTRMVGLSGSFKCNRVSVGTKCAMKCTIKCGLGRAIHLIAILVATLSRPTLNRPA